MAYNILMVLPKCKDCGAELKDRRSKLCKSCSKKGERNPMSGVWGQDSPNWKGGYVNKHLGYRIICRNGKRMYEHRWIMEQHIGRRLDAKEVVHHINHDKTDNRIENLVVISQGEHVNIHKPMLGKKSTARRNPITQRFEK